MEITWGFLLLFTLFIFPGLIIRRLYFFGEFSKQFGYDDPLLKSVAYALVPGLINVIFAFLLYNSLFGGFDLGKVFDAYKDMSDGAHRYLNDPGFSVDEHVRTQVLPFLALLYMQACIIGALAGQVVRWSGMDIKFKLFRYKNQWFYLFTGNHRRLKKYKPYFADANRFLFLKADVLVEVGGTTKLYSGTLVDYELDPANCRELSKVVLKDGHRYTKNEVGNIGPKSIPGNMLVVECSKLVNINLTHVYESDQERHARTQVFRQIWNNTFVVITILLLPFLFFRIGVIDGEWYDRLMGLTWLGKFFAWVTLAQVLQLLNYVVPEPNTKEYGIATWKVWVLKVVMIPGLYWITTAVDALSRWILSWFA